MSDAGRFSSQTQQHPGIAFSVLGQFIEPLIVTNIRQSRSDKLRGSQYGGFGFPSFHELRGISRASQFQSADCELGDVGVFNRFFLAALGWQLAPGDQRLPGHP